MVLPPQCSTFSGHWGGSPRHKDEQWGGRSTLSLWPPPPQSRVRHPPRGRAWVRSLRQSQEGRKEGRNCNSSSSAGHTGKGGREAWMQNTWEGGERRKKRKSRESTRDALRTESSSGLDHCPRSLARWLRHILGCHSRPVAGKQAGRLPLWDRGAGGGGCSETTAELLTGPGQGSSSYWFSTGLSNERTAVSKAQASLLPRASWGKGDVGGIPHRTLSTSRSLKSSLGPRVCLPLPPVLRRLTHCWLVFGDRPALSCGPAAPALSGE